MKRLLFVFILCLLQTACNDKPLEVPNIERGKALFKQTHINKSLGCIACHSFSADTKTTGPSLSGIGIRAGMIYPNMTAEAYLYESITNPDAYIVAGYEPNIMYNNYKNELSQQELTDLVAFLLTQ